MLRSWPTLNGGGRGHGTAAEGGRNTATVNFDVVSPVLKAADVARTLVPDKAPAPCRATAGARLGAPRPRLLAPLSPETAPPGGGRR